MTTDAENKYPNLQLVRGNGPRSTRILIRGRRKGRRTRTAAELVLERWAREEFNALTDPNGNRPSEAIQKICQGEQFPLNYFGRRMVEAHAAGCTGEQAMRLWSRVGVWLEKLFAASLAGETITERVFFQGPRMWVA